jgi:hypothetical protein
MASALIVTTIFLSWTLLDNYGATSTSSSSLSRRDKLSDEVMFGFITVDGFTPQTHQPPAAEDVLVQKIPEDNNHLLLMAYYSKGDYSEPSFTIENGYTITFRDDGKGDDKVAGDGLYTAMIPADISAFRSQAVSMVKKMKSVAYKPICYLDRQRIINPDAAESFEIAKFDANEPVSVSGLTNALSADFGAETTAQDSMSASSAANGAVAATTSLTAKTSLATAAPTTSDSIKKNCVLITDLAVVEDPARTWNYCTQKGKLNGPWTFGNLMRQLASKSPTQIATDARLSDFVKNWLNSWANQQTINKDPIAARTLVNSVILNPWLTKSRNVGAPAGQLDMRFAPFKLLTIANRFDLRTAKTCGEGRFVFCLISSDCSGPQQFTVIFEYGINKPGTCQGQHGWAQQWANLKNFPLGSAQYNQALQNITDQFTKCGTNPSRTNQSSLDQLRTNDVALASATIKRFEFREFILDNSTGNLKENTVAETPEDKYNAQVVNADVQHMVSFVNANAAKIIAGTDTMPLTWQGSPLLAGASRINGNPTGKPTGDPSVVYHWDGTGPGNASTFITDDNARSRFSLLSCSGCHAGETQTAFTHINPVFFGKQAGLSGFLSGVKGIGGAIDFDHDSANLLMQVKDPALRPSTNPTMRNFNDIDRRVRDLKSTVSSSCGTVLAISSQLMFQPVNMVH